MRSGVFLTNFECLEMWSNIQVFIFWYIFSIKIKTKEETEKWNHQILCTLRSDVHVPLLILCLSLMQALIPGKVKWVREFSPPFFWVSIFLFFLIPQILTSNTSTRLWFYYIITKIHTPFQNPGSTPVDELLMHLRDKRKKQASYSVAFSRADSSDWAELPRKQS